MLTSRQCKVLACFAVAASFAPAALAAQPGRAGERLVLSGINGLKNVSRGILGEPVQGQEATWRVAARPGEIVRVAGAGDWAYLIVSGREREGAKFSASGGRWYLDDRVIGLDLRANAAARWPAAARKAELADVSYVRTDVLDHEARAALLRLRGRPIMVAAKNFQQVAAVLPQIDLHGLVMARASVGEAELARIGDLRTLRCLHLYSCKQVRDLTPLAKLTALTSLSLSRCKQVSDLTPLADLTAIRSLTLFLCDQVSDLTPLAKLTALTSLDLPPCTTDEQLAAICREHPGLTSLDLSRCDQVTDLTPLHRLKRLDYVFVSECAKVSKEQLAALKNALPKCRIE